jgi:ribonucleoside-diphosphate reductase alpha chain
MEYRFTKHAKALLKNYYMKASENTPDEAFKRAAYAYTSDQDLAERIYSYAKKGWFMYSSPILSNAGNSGLPISCFLLYVPDNVEGLIKHSEELRWMSVMGGGVGGHWSDVRAVSQKAPGPLPFLKTVDSDMLAYSQGQTRRGSYAAYLDVSHPDLIEFLNFRLPTGGDSNRKCFNLHNAINITDSFLEAVVNAKPWMLVDPKDSTVRQETDARELWTRILETRFRTGEPYLNFIDTANKALPPTLKNKGLKINGSNLCNEIHLPTSSNRSAVCCLSSLNLEFYEDWKDTSIVQDLICYLDDVLEYFIQNAPPVLAKAIHSARRERSLGLGAMGFHSFLQKKMVPFESIFAVSANRKIFSHIKKQALIATKKMALQKGAFLDDDSNSSRNSHLLAIAPNANSSIILNTSPSIEPWKSNAYTHRTRAGSFLQVNKYLTNVLEEHSLAIPAENFGTQDILLARKSWVKQQVQSIILAQGSVQHLDFLTKLEKDTFKTAFEIDQMWVIEHASIRQEWVCQGQSVNLFFPAGSDINYVNLVHLAAWRKSLKGLYYLRTSAGITGEKISTKIERRTLKEIEECLSCQG